MMLNVRYFMIFLGVRNIAMSEKIMEEQGATWETAEHYSFTMAG
jgi:hypothetical protein